MNKEMKKVEETMEKGVDTVVNTFVDRAVDKIDKIEPTMEKGKKTLEKMAELTADGIGAVIDAVADHFAGIVNGEGIDLKKEKERAKDTMETLVEKTGEYIEVVAESISGGIAQAEEDMVKDVKAAKKMKDELKENYHNLKEDIHKSLKRLKTDYIDIYMLHRDHPDADIEAILEVLNEYHKAGKIGAFGASNWSHDRIAKVNEYALKKGLIPFTVSSPNYGPATQVEDPWGGGCVSISGKENEEARKWYIDNELPVFAYSCLGRGMFSGKVKTTDLENSKMLLDKYALKGYWCQENINRLVRMELLAQEKNCSMSQLTLAWIIQQELDVFPIVTISDRRRIKENIAALKIELSKEEINIISES